MQLQIIQHLEHSLTFNYRRSPDPELIEVCVCVDFTSTVVDNVRRNDFNSLMYQLNP